MVSSVCCAVLRCFKRLLTMFRAQDDMLRLPWYPARTQQPCASAEQYRRCPALQVAKQLQHSGKSSCSSPVAASLLCSLAVQFWDPIAGNCLCQSSACSFTDAARPIGASGVAPKLTCPAHIPSMCAPQILLHLPVRQAPRLAPRRLRFPVRRPPPTRRWLYKSVSAWASLHSPSSSPNTPRNASFIVSAFKLCIHPLSNSLFNCLHTHTYVAHTDPLLLFRNASLFRL